MNQATQTNGSHNGFIAIKDDALDANATGLMVYWDLSGNVSLDKLTDALAAATSHATPPEEPSVLVALHRAVDAVAKLTKADAHMVSRGEWRIVGEAKQMDSLAGATGKVLAYPVNAEACVDGDGILAVGEGADKITEAFYAAKQVLAPSDVGHWLGQKLRGLKAVPMREAGGVYFVPKFSVDKFRKLQRGVEACSAHKIRTVPAMRTADALDAILAAITADTKAACDKIVEEIPTAGKRALATRENATMDLMSRVEGYEKLLGQRLTELRAAIEETRMATATAMLALGGDGDAE